MRVTGVTEFEGQWSNNTSGNNAFGAFFNASRSKQESFDDGNLGIMMNYDSIQPEEDPYLLQAARSIYEIYYTVHPEVTDLPLGVAIDRTSYRGKLIFKQKPALLPKECFIPFSSIDIR